MVNFLIETSYKTRLTRTIVTIYSLMRLLTTHKKLGHPPRVILVYHHRIVSHFSNVNCCFRSGIPAFFFVVFVNSCRLYSIIGIIANFCYAISSQSVYSSTRRRKNFEALNGNLNELLR